MTGVADSKSLDAPHNDTKAQEVNVEVGCVSDGEKRPRDMKADAVDAENAELNLGVIAAVKGYPMAALRAILTFLAPESPWWLTCRGKREQTAKAVGRLGKKRNVQANQQSVAMMRRATELEVDRGEPSLPELFKGVNLYRTALSVMCTRRDT